MGKVLDITGQKFNRLLVLEYVDLNKSKKSQWKCLCECGKEVIVVSTNLKNGNTKSCGCYGVDSIIKRSTTHGFSKTRLHDIWGNMRYRCRGKSNQCRFYGLKGISVCDEWEQSFVLFKEWADANGYQNHLSIERINVNGNYEPSNCKWIPRADQSKNQSTTIYVTLGSETKRLLEWCEFYNINPRTAYSRMQRGKEGYDLF